MRTAEFGDTGRDTARDMASWASVIWRHAPSRHLENVPGHIGPHPEEYHQIVFSTLTKAVGTKTGAAATRALRAALGKLAKECRTRGTLLNDLLTKKGPFVP